MTSFVGRERRQTSTSSSKHLWDLAIRALDAAKWIRLDNVHSLPYARGICSDDV